jgi:uncharacterized membrane protein YcaP (DUF421 family)
MTHGFSEMIQIMSHNMFHVPVPLLEKVLRPAIVYLFLIVFLRLFGKRELAQLNPFDLVVLLSLSNTVQNAMIGDDNSVSGGVVGAFSLLAINWLLMRVLFKAPKLNAALQGKAATLITAGKVNDAVMKQETMSQEDLIAVLNRNGFNDPSEVETCILEPNGTFYVKGRSPSGDDVARQEMMEAMERLSAEVRALRAQMAGR